MKTNLGKVTALLAALFIGGLTAAWVIQGDRAQGQGGGAGGAAAGPRYSVVETEGHNLIVTDNKSNTLYFYTIDKDAAIGSALKLRGSVDLNKVGSPSIQPFVAKKKQNGGEP
jgi:hypothetical protein